MDVGARRAWGVAALSLAAALCVVPAILTPASGAGTAAEVVPLAQMKPKTLVLRAKPIPLSAPEIANPMRGQYEWLGAAAQPQAWPVRDVYYRDQVAWKRIEPSPGVYDFSWFDK